MLGSIARRPKTRSEGEKPFWISYADLMTAMMTLFMAAMAVTMVSISEVMEREQSMAEQRDADIKNICRKLGDEFEGHPYIHVDCVDNRISFGKAGYFGHNDYHLPESANESLAKLVPSILNVADSELGRRWFKQVVIEGFTDTDGSYLYNLHLSLMRSEWVMCMLLDPAKNTEMRLTPAQLQRVRDLFLAGGVSFNSAKENKEESRRVELRLQFYGLDERDGKDIDKPTFHSSAVDECKLR